MIKYFIYFLQSVRLVRRPTVPLPYKVRTKAGQRRTNTQPDTDKHTSSDGHQFIKKGDAHNPEWERVDKNVRTDPKRVQILTKWDYAELADNPKLNVDKYSAIKFYWGRGLSNSQIVEEMKNQGKFSLSTVERYTPAMSRAVSQQFSPSPTVESG